MDIEDILSWLMVAFDAFPAVAFEDFVSEVRPTKIDPVISIFFGAFG